jgi:pyruvate,orthophosphate dikinase
MVFGNGGVRSGSGVGFTRNPATGEDELFVDFLFNAQGQDLGSGREAVEDGDLLQHALPDVWAELQGTRGLLEREFNDMQDFEFTVQDGRVFFLQTRSGQRTSWAAARIAVDLVRDGVVEQSTALDRLAPYDLSSIVRRSVAASVESRPIGSATGAGPGVATGEVAFDVERARRRAASHSIVLVRPQMSADDLPGIAVADGVLAASGGRTSHAAVVARQLGKPCVVGCTGLRIDEDAHACTLGAWVLREGDVITIDGGSGLIYAGDVAAVDERPDDTIAIIESWRRQKPGAVSTERTLN